MPKEVYALAHFVFPLPSPSIMLLSVENKRAEWRGLCQSEMKRARDILLAQSNHTVRILMGRLRLRGTT